MITKSLADAEGGEDGLEDGGGGYGAGYGAKVSGCFSEVLRKEVGTQAGAQAGVQALQGGVGREEGLLMAGVGDDELVFGAGGFGCYFSQVLFDMQYVGRGVGVDVQVVWREGWCAYCFVGFGQYVNQSLVWMQVVGDFVKLVELG